MKIEVTYVGEHEFGLVAVSIGIAILASYAALDLAARVRASTGWARGAWLAAAAVAMGGGIWSMHFVAMLAYRLPGIELHFDIPLTLISLLLPIGVTAFGFFVESRRGSGFWSLAGSGSVMGVGIAVMHYTGMAALVVPATLDYDWLWVTVSVLIAIMAATAALRLAFRENRFGQRLLASCAMGLAIAGMHYSAMLGVQFTPEEHVHPFLSFGQVNQTHLALWITTTTFLVLALGLLAATYDRNLAAHAAREAAALRASEERFRLLLQSVTDYAIYMLDPQGRIMNWNAGAERVKGYTEDEIIGRHFSCFYLPEEREAGAPEAALEAAARLGKHEGEGWRIRKDGSRFWASVVIHPVHDEGRLIGFAKVTRDVTERRQNQQALERAREALAQSQKMEAIGQLTGGIAHDFNNLLMAVLGSLELLKKRLPDDPKLVRLLDNAVLGAQRGATLTQRMLSFARRQDLKPGAVELPRLVQGMADLLQRSLGPSYKIETRFPLDLPKAEVDAHQLEIAVLNLAVNARDAMPHGGTVVIGGQEVARDMTDEPMVSLYVKDAGEGMDARTLARAQEPFFTTKGVGKGTGLGLPMVQGLAEQSRGRLVLASEKGKGTTAEIWLPLAKAAESADAGRMVDDAANVVRSTRSLTVLVVDDDALVLDNTASMLEDLGHRVIEARSGEEALQLLRRARRIDLVITDHAMPGMTGLELIERIRQERAGARVILATGFAELSALPNDIPKLDKPFDQMSLARTIYAAVATNVVPFPAGSSHDHPAGSR